MLFQCLSGNLTHPVPMPMACIASHLNGPARYTDSCCHFAVDCRKQQTRTSNDENCLTSTAPDLKSSAAPPFQCRHSATTSSRKTVALFTFAFTSSHNDDRHNFRTSPPDILVTLVRHQFIQYEVVGRVRGPQ